MAKILSIIPHEFYPPKYGGALRCFYILREIARHHEVTLLTVQPLPDFLKPGNPFFPEHIKVVSIEGQNGYASVFDILPTRIAHAINSRILQRSLFRKGNLYLLKSYPVLKRLFKENKFDFVMYESLESFSVLNAPVKKLSFSVKHIYDAHNVDSLLWQQQSKQLRDNTWMKINKKILSRESNLYRFADLCFCCSNADRENLISLNKNRLKAVVIPNGVDCIGKPYKPFTRHPLKNILFCGTLDYMPNAEGLKWFHEKIFPLIKKRIPGLTFTVIGKMNQRGDYESLKKDESVDFIGAVDDVATYYRSSSLLVVPLLGGSGTRLKILEAMSFGNPVVSTSIGAEGLELKNGEHILLADNAEDFSNAVIELLENVELFEQIRINARAHVESQYDWRIIGKKIEKELAAIE